MRVAEGQWARLQFLARDKAVENWLQQQVGPVYDALVAKPERGLTAEQVRASLQVQARLSRHSRPDRESMDPRVREADK